MALMNGEKYRESLRKMKPLVYLFGERLTDPVDHPMVIPSQNAVAMTYDLAHDPKYEDLMTVTSPLTGGKINRFGHIYQSIDDMVKKVKMARLVGQKTCTCFQRCPTMDTANSLFIVTKEMDKKLGTQYHERFLKFMREVQENDYYVGVAMTDVKGDRSLRPHEQADPDLYLHVVEEKKDGIVVRGAKANQTGSINCHYTFVAPTAAMKKEDRDYAVAFAVPAGSYKVRADFLGYQFWSPETHVTIDTNIDFTIAHQDAIVTLDGGPPEIFDPLAGIKVYLFTPSGAYLGEKRVTEENGQARFHLPRQPYKIRADFLGQQYWSDVFTWTDPTITIPMADVELILGGGGIPVQDQAVYVFSASGAYLGIRQTTDSDGKVFFRLPQGEYKFRADYQGSRYWSDATWVTADQLNVTTISTGGGSFAVSVLEANAKPLAGVKCYVFSASHTYLGIYGATDGNGQVFFDLADGDFKFRVDYLGSQFWSDEAAVPEVLSTDMVIAHETVEVTVTTGAGAVEGVKVYLFSANGTYLGRYQETDTAGIVSFDLPVGNNYQFRVDILGSRHWSDVLEVCGGVTNFVEIDAGGGLLQMTVQKDENLPMPGLKVYLFDAAGTYLGRSATTDAFGQVEFRVPGEVYTLRVDYLGYQFWSAEIVVAENTVMEMPIIHRQVEIIAQGSFQGMSVPIGGIKVYLFSPTDTYLGQHQITGSDGQVAFSLPDQSFRVRVDYLGHPFWSEDFRSQDSTVTINRGLIEIHARRFGVDMAGARVYLFHEKGSYLGWNETTNPSGKAAFMLPDHAFKFRIDENGEQHWTPLIQVHAGEESVVEGDMDQ